MSALANDIGTLRASIRPGELRVASVSKSYGDAQLRTEVVKDCSFTLERSKLTVMIGPSGCGKSTLIRLLAGFEKPESGTITLNDAPVSGPARDRLVLFQESALKGFKVEVYDAAFRRHAAPRGARARDGQQSRGHDPR